MLWLPKYFVDQITEWLSREQTSKECLFLHYDYNLTDKIT